MRASVRTVHSGKPTQGRVSFTAEFDVFAQQNQKLVTSYSTDYDSVSNEISFKETFGIKSAGLGIDVQLSEEGRLNRETYSAEYTGSINYHIGMYIVFIKYRYIVHSFL